jgi:outer membrane lipoprotein carrier protein
MIRSLPLSSGLLAVALLLGCQDAHPPSGDAAPASGSAAALASASAAPAETPDAATPRADASPGVAIDAGEPPEPARDAGPPGMPTDAGVESREVRADTKPDAGHAKLAVDAGTKAPAASATASASAAALPPAPEPGSADAVAAQVDAIFAGVKLFRAKFKQDYRIKVTGQTKTSTGMISVERPSKISFRYDPPNRNRVVSDGALMKVYVADDAQMFVQPAAGTEYPGALAFLMGHGLRPSFTFTINDKIQWAAGPVLVGKPREPNPSYESVLFYVSRDGLEKKDPNVIQKVLVLDAQGNRNTFTFEQASVPSHIEPAEFVFEPPPGTTVTKR